MYLHRGIASRGLILRCSHCGGTSFYLLEEVGTTFRCFRCRQANEVLRTAWKGPREPQWFYGLDEVVVQAIGSDIRVPLRALATLADRAKSFLFMPEAVVRTPNYSDVEIDLWALVDGAIVIGEAKLGDQLEATDNSEKKRCRALRQIAEALSIDEFVMATGAVDWRTRTKSNVDDTIGVDVPVRWISELGV